MAMYSRLVSYLITNYNGPIIEKISAKIMASANDKRFSYHTLYKEGRITQMVPVLSYTKSSPKLKPYTILVLISSSNNYGSRPEKKFRLLD